MAKSYQAVLFVVILFLKLVSLDFFSLNDYGININNAYSTISKYTNFERCDSYWVPNNVTALNEILRRNVFGQPLMKKILVSVLRAHVETETGGPLFLSFHGNPGVGKTFVVEILAKSLFRKGIYSKFIHVYVGSANFPFTNNTKPYEIEIEDAITSGTRSCKWSLFVFDEVHKLQAGVLNKISSMMKNARFGKGNFGQAIFIFLSNTGSDMIVEKTLELMEKQVVRENYVLVDFEHFLMDEANKNGGLKRSDMILNGYIDHYIPFLPLEIRHVVKCVRAEMDRQNIPKEVQTLDFINSVIKEAVIFEPPPHYYFSRSGCKRIAQKVAMLKMTSGVKWTTDEDDISKENDEL